MPHLSVDSVFVLLVCVVWWYSVVYVLFAHTVVQVPLCVWNSVYAVDPRRIECRDREIV